jgi:hypothetical protein
MKSKEEVQVKLAQLDLRKAVAVDDVTATRRSFTFDKPNGVGVC